MEEPREKKTTPLARLKTLQGAVVIITGAASGIGAALAKQVAADGAQAVVLVDRQVDKANSVAKEISTKNSSIATKVHEVDVRDFGRVQAVVTETKQQFGRLDYIFNNAATTASGSLEQIGVEDFNYVLDVNLRGVANGVHAAYPVMKEQGFGHIVNTISLAGLLPCWEGMTAYGTSKYAVVGLSLNLRVEAARHGVHVSALCPGLVDTPLLYLGEFGKNKGNVSKEALDKLWDKFHRMDTAKFAVKALKLVVKNKPIIIVPAYPWKLFCLIHRLFPRLGLYLATKRNNKIVRMRMLEKDAAKGDGE